MQVKWQRHDEQQQEEGVERVEFAETLVPNYCVARSSVDLRS